jgi:gluconate 2-dehydrogenase gamma chain
MVDSLAPFQMSRRSLLVSTAALFVTSKSSRARTIGQGMPWWPGSASSPIAVRAGSWMFFTADEAALVEAVADRLIPPDDRGPGGKDAGCAVFIDRQLAGPYGRAEGQYMTMPFMSGTATQGYQMSEAPADRYRAGLKAIVEHVTSAYGGKTFAQLAPQDQDEVLSGIESGSVTLANVDGKGFFALLLQNTQEGFFADPIYGGNRAMAGWKLVGFPGARYDYRDWVERHNEPYPLPPVSIAGRSDWTARE